METFKRTPLELFLLPQHFIIPLFQRPYVWKQEEQWEPLWKDIRRVAELRMNEPHLTPQHFLGAVVLQAQDAVVNQVTGWNVIDGQQRLTTLQLIMDATSSALAQAGLDRLANQLDSLTHNSANFIPEGQSRLKLRHLNNDRDAFTEVMEAEPPIDYTGLKHRDSQIVKAHEYFANAVTQWLGDLAQPECAAKAEHLANVLQGDLQLVTILLMSSENSQEIFETLNARGTPLTAADLVRNFVFQRLEAEGGDIKRAYKEVWPFATKFWSKEISVGRNFVSRSSLFLNQWLISRMGEEISPQSTFTRFKSYVEHSGHDMAGLLPVLKEQAQRYESWTEAASRKSGDLDVVEMSVYRMQASGIELLKPLLLWLHEPGKDLPSATLERIVAAAESWVVRRQFMRMSNSDLGRVVADIIKVHDRTPASELADRVIGYLSRLNVASTYWPGDDEVRSQLATEAVYRRYPRGRTRMFLEAIENAYRKESNQPQVERVGYPIEHILPRTWEETWPVDSPERSVARQERVHRLGNLTLLTASLNSKVSNGPWTSKRTAFLQHSTMKLTGRLFDATEGVTWDEERIDARTNDMIDVLLRVWPVPDGHVGKVVDPQSKAQDWVEVKHLVEAEFLSLGDKLFATPATFTERQAVIGPDSRIHIDGNAFGSPSGAGRHLTGKATNGWYFWSVADGRRLRDVRAAFLDRREAGG